MNRLGEEIVGMFIYNLVLRGKFTTKIWSKFNLYIERYFFNLCYFM